MKSSKNWWYNAGVGEACRYYAVAALIYLGLALFFGHCR